MSIVHAETDFFAPIFVGDYVSIELNLSKKGTSSFTIEGQVKKEGDELVGKTCITHVCVSKESGKSMSLPKILLNHLAQL